MTPATLSPPPQEPAAPDTPDRLPLALPVFPNRPPLRPLRRDPTGRVTRRGIILSLAAHLLLALAFVLAPERAPQRVADGGRALPDERVEYIDVGGWPAGTPDGVAAPPAGAPATTMAGAAAEPAVTAAAADSALARTQPVPRFPDRVPDRLPPAPRGGAPGGVGPGVRPGAAPGAGQQGGAAGANGIGNDAAGGRLGPGYRDPRLIVRPEAVSEPELTEHQRYMRALGRTLNAYNDSVAEEADHQRRIRNWTVKDKDGREWGIGPDGKARLGGVTVPIPIAPPIPREGRDREDARRREAQQREQIQRQAEDLDRDRNFADRARATRERNDANRRKQREEQGESSGSSSSTQP